MIRFRVIFVGGGWTEVGLYSWHEFGQWADNQRPIASVEVRTEAV